jgi:2-polyprenyl-3-methyl-5-hydroxy-6-metoxy-1,4-benzoquinol methylase
MNTGERDGSTSLPSKDPKTLSKRTEKEKFKEKEYWDERYETEETFDWFCQLSSFEHLLFQHIKPSDRILNLGCGNSSLSVSLYVKGYQNIENMDFSQTVISRMKERTCDMMPNMKWHVMDMLNLAFDSGGFDVVLDKGSMDALMVDQGDVWKPRQEVIGRVEKAIAEVR